MRFWTRRSGETLSKNAEYVGSAHHTDVPKYNLGSAPREGWTTVESAGASGLKNPACMVCPRKWVTRQKAATTLLQEAIKAGYFVGGAEDQLPGHVWARDPDDPDLVYEAKLCSPPHGYKAYPLTDFQAKFNLPFVLP